MEEKPKWRPLNPGRKKIYGEETKTMRVPVSMVEKCREWLKEQMKMKTIILIGLLMSFPAYADDMEQTRKDILIAYAKQYGWCELPKPELKPGEIAIEWEYDADGNCTVQKVRVGK